MKYDMKDLTVLIPVRIDSITRLENLHIVIKYLMNNFKLNIIITEASEYDNNLLKTILPKSVKYNFIKDKDPVFYRTKYINMMVAQTETEFLAIWDADVVFPIKQVRKAVELLRTNKYDIVFPYDGMFLDTTKIIRQIFLYSEDLNFLEETSDMMISPYGYGMKGGAFIANKRKYIDAGMENLKFYGWGPEDWERYERWMNLNYRIKCVKGNLFHLSHPRDMNGTHNSLQQKLYSFYEKDITSLSSAEEIKHRMNLK